MKIRLMLIVIILLFTGCANHKEVIEISEHNKAIELSKEKELSNLELELNDVTTKYEDIKEKYYLLSKTLNHDKENKSQVFHDTKINDEIIRIYTDGTVYIENGVDCILEVLNDDGSIWKRVWEGIQVTELEMYSPISVVENRIYIVIDGSLYLMDIDTGEIIWNVDNVGSSHIGPVVDSDGCVYTTGQYIPYLTAVDSNGKLKWQIESEDLYGIQSITLQDKFLKVGVFDKFVLVDKDGKFE